jgi:hypothetical protein
MSMHGQAISYQGKRIVAESYDMLRDCHLLKFEDGSRMSLAKEVFREEFRFAVGMVVIDPRPIARIAISNNDIIGKALAPSIPTPVKLAKPKVEKPKLASRTAVIVSTGWGGGVCRGWNDSPI